MLLPLQDLAADYPLFHARRFYPTLGRYPGHRAPFGPDLVGEPLGTSRNLTVSRPPGGATSRALYRSRQEASLGGLSAFVRSRCSTVAHEFSLVTRVLLFRFTTTHRIKKELSICQS